MSVKVLLARRANVRRSQAYANDGSAVECAESLRVRKQEDPPMAVQGKNNSKSGTNELRAISGHARETLDTIYRHPISHGLAWDAVVLLVGRLGTVDERSNDHFVFTVGDERLTVQKPHTKHLTAPELFEIRHFLSQAGYAPRAAHGGKIDQSPRPE